jgi:HEPN domain-containing protein
MHNIRNWLEQAKSDLESAEILFNNNKFSQAVFYCHQSCEKALKYAVMLRTKEEVVISHSLIYLGKTIDLPSAFLDRLRLLNPHYTLSRYPGAEGDTPDDIYTKEEVQKHLTTTKELLEWIKKRIK